MQNPKQIISNVTYLMLHLNLNYAQMKLKLSLNAIYNLNRSRGTVKKKNEKLE